MRRYTYETFLSLLCLCVLMIVDLNYIIHLIKFAIDDWLLMNGIHIFSYTVIPYHCIMAYHIWLTIQMQLYIYITHQIKYLQMELLLCWKERDSFHKLPLYQCYQVRYTSIIVTTSHTLHIVVINTWYITHHTPPHFITPRIIASFRITHCGWLLNVVNWFVDGLWLTFDWLLLITDYYTTHDALASHHDGVVMHHV